MDDQDWSDTFYSPGIRFLDAVLPSEGQWETGCARIKEIGYDEDELERHAAGGVVEEKKQGRFDPLRLQGLFLYGSISMSVSTFLMAALLRRDAGKPVRVR